MPSSDNYCPSIVVRKGDFIWLRGKKRIWRLLSKEERRFAIARLKDQDKSKNYRKKTY